MDFFSLLLLLLSFVPNIFAALVIPFQFDDVTIFAMKFQIVSMIERHKSQIKLLNTWLIKQLSDRNINQWFEWNFKISCISQIYDSKCYKWDEEIGYLSKIYNFKPVHLITVSFDANRRVQNFLISINSEHYHKERKKRLSKITTNWIP